ncbi:MAG: hypothetical protein RLZZ440_1147 [Planctomycetota bacterium]|jgi:hypothetical protein
MASKKHSKKSLSQQVMGVATMGMPAPVQQVAASKWGSKLLLLIVPLLIASGVITISFTGGKPSVNINEQRAQQVGEELREDAVRAAEQVRERNANRFR